MSHLGHFGLDQANRTGFEASDGLGSRVVARVARGIEAGSPLSWNDS